MKRRFSGTRCSASLFVFLAVALHASTHAFAQTLNAQGLPVLEVSPATLGADGIVTLSLNAAPQGKSTRVAIYEHLRPTKLAEIKKKFEGQNGRWSTQVSLQADPGLYDFRIVSDDKTRASLSWTPEYSCPESCASRAGGC